MYLHVFIFLVLDTGVEMLGHKCIFKFIRKETKDSSAVKSTGCSSTGPVFNSQHPQSLTAVCNSSSRDACPLVAFVSTGTHVLHTHTCRQTLMHIKYIFKKVQSSGF